MSLQFIQWLKRHLNDQTPGCVWIDEHEQTFKILWPRADRTTSADRLGVMFKWWTHKFGNTRNHNQPTAIKGNFRSCLNSKVQSGEIIKMPSFNKREEQDDWKAFKFTNAGDKVKHIQHNRKRMASHTADDMDSSPPYGGSIYGSYSLQASCTDVKIEMQDDPLDSLKKGPTLKVLVNQPYMANNQLVKTHGDSNLFENAPIMSTCSSAVTSPNFVVPKTKPQLPVEPIVRKQSPGFNDMDSVKRLQYHMEHLQRAPSGAQTGLMPIVKNSRSLAVEARTIRKDGTQGNNALEASIIADYNKILQGVQAKHIQDILQEMLSGKTDAFKTHFEDSQNMSSPKQEQDQQQQKPQQEQQQQQLQQQLHQQQQQQQKQQQQQQQPQVQPVIVQKSDPDDANNLPSFLQYIGKELENMPFEAQELAKKEIFRVVSELKKQSSMFLMPQWQLNGSQQATKDICVQVKGTVPLPPQ